MPRWQHEHFALVYDRALPEFSDWLMGVSHAFYMGKSTEQSKVHYLGRSGTIGGATVEPKERSVPRFFGLMTDRTHYEQPPVQAWIFAPHRAGQTARIQRSRDSKTLSEWSVELDRHGLGLTELTDEALGEYTLKLDGLCCRYTLGAPASEKPQRPQAPVELVNWGLRTVAQSAPFSGGQPRAGMQLATGPSPNSTAPFRLTRVDPGQLELKARAQIDAWHLALYPERGARTEHSGEKLALGASIKLPFEGQSALLVAGAQTVGRCWEGAAFALAPDPFSPSLEARETSEETVKLELHGPKDGTALLWVRAQPGAYTMQQVFAQLTLAQLQRALECSNHGRVTRRLSERLQAEPALPEPAQLRASLSNHDAQLIFAERIELDAQGAAQLEIPKPQMPGPIQAEALCADAESFGFARASIPGAALKPPSEDQDERPSGLLSTLRALLGSR